MSLARHDSRKRQTDGPSTLPAIYGEDDWAGGESGGARSGECVIGGGVEGGRQAVGSKGGRRRGLVGRKTGRVGAA